MTAAKRLSAWREEQLNKEYTETGEICNICMHSMTKWVQVGTGWASGYYERCLACGSNHFQPAHNYCVPFCVKDYGWLNKIACRLRKDCEGGKLLVANCKYCKDNK